MHSDDESDRDEDFNFHFRVKILPFRAPLLLQIFNALDELDAAMAKSAEKVLVQRSASKRVERRQIGDIPSTAKAPTLLPRDLYDNQWLADNKIHTAALRLASNIGLRNLILD